MKKIKYTVDLRNKQTGHMLLCLGTFDTIEEANAVLKREQKLLHADDRYLEVGVLHV